MGMGFPRMGHLFKERWGSKEVDRLQLGQSESSVQPIEQLGNLNHQKV